MVTLPSLVAETGERKQDQCNFDRFHTVSSWFLETAYHYNYLFYGRKECPIMFYLECMCLSIFKIQHFQ